MTISILKSGIWAQDGDDERPSFGDSKKRKKDSAPVQFVSGGIKIGSRTELPDVNFLK